MKLFFLDIDGTIAVPGTDPSPELYSVIRQLQNQGDRVFLCTGRNECFIAEAVRNLGCNGGIYSAGGRIVVGQKEIFNAPLSGEKLAQLLPIVTESRIAFTLECENRSYKYSTRAREMAAASTLWNQLHSELKRFLFEDSNGTYLFPYDAYDGEPVFKVSFLTCGREPVSYLEDHLPDWARLTIFRNSIEGLPLSAGEISDRETTKGSALARVCEYCGVSTSDCIAFGDSMNDADVLRAAGLGIAMGNSDPEVKALADRVCGSCEDNGLAKALTEFLCH